MVDGPSIKSIRWWPVTVILGLFMGVLIFIWGFSGWMHSLRLNGSIGAGLGTFGLLSLWFFFLSRIRLKIKLWGFAGLFGLVSFLVWAVEIREVSGDVVPIIAWKWTPKPNESLANATVTAKTNDIDGGRDGNEYPRFLGRHSDGTVADFGLARDWSARPPLEKWRIPVGDAWSSFAVQNGLAITQEQRDEMEMVTCYDVETGELVWAHGDPQRFDTVVAGLGPRATPTIAGDKVYTFGALGLLNCLELSTGKLIWQKHTAVENKAEKPRWGYSSSPLVLPANASGTGALVVVSPGGPNGRSLVAYHAETGAFVWSGGNAKPGYSSPQTSRLAGQEMILIFNNGSVAGHHPEDGRVLSEMPWEGDKPCVANPRCLPDDRVLVSAGYGIGSKMYRITRKGDHFSANLLYESRRLKAKFANFIIHGGDAYGLDDGVLTCLDTTTGERVWKKGRFGHGQIMLVGELLLIQAENGELSLLQTHREGYEVLASLPVLNGKSWNTFALAGNLLLMRNHREAVCLALPLKQQSDEGPNSISR